MKFTSGIKRSSYIFIFVLGIIFISGQLSLSSNKADVKAEAAKQIEVEVELRNTGQSNHKLSIENALALKNVKTTQGGIEKDKLESLITARINEPLKGRSFEPKTPEAKRAELAKLDKLYASTKPAKVLLNSSGQPKAIYPKYTQPVESHDAFIKDSARLLDLNIPGSSLNVTKENRCIGDQCVSRYQRMAFGVPVLFSDMALTTVNGKVTSITGALNQPNISKQIVENGDVLSEADLLEVAQSKLLGQWHITNSTYGIYESTGGAAPAYQVELRSGFRQYDMVIHAGTKTILNENDHLKHNTNASGLDLRGQRREFNTISSQGRNYLVDNR